MSNPKALFEEDSSDDETDLKVNKSYAENYERWRGKEEYQKLKDRYGEDAPSESETSTDDELAGTENAEFDMDFFRIIAAIQLKHPILDENKKFFKDKYEFAKEENSAEDKPLTVKDYERKLILERKGKYDEEQEFEGNNFETEETIHKGKRKCGFQDDNLSDSEGEKNDEMSSSGFFKINKERKIDEGQQEKQKKNNDAISFLKGEKKKLESKLDEELLSGLKKEWETNMSADDKFLMDYFVNQRYLEEEDADREREPNHFPLDIESLSDDEKTFDQMEEYETKFRFRYEEPDEDFIQSHPRIIDDSMRKKESKRKEIRDKRKERKQQENERRKQEIKRMKALKRMQIMERIQKIKEISGKEDLNLEQIDLDDEFDPDKHDAAMGRIFNDEYYEQELEDERDKPSIEDEELRRNTTFLTKD